MDLFQKLIILFVYCLPWWCLHLVEGLFIQVMELEFVIDLDSYSGGRLAAGRSLKPDSFGQVVGHWEIPWPFRLRVVCETDTLTL